MLFHHWVILIILELIARVVIGKSPSPIYLVSLFNFFLKNSIEKWYVHQMIKSYKKKGKQRWFTLNEEKYALLVIWRRKLGKFFVKFLTSDVWVFCIRAVRLAHRLCCSLQVAWKLMYKRTFVCSEWWSQLERTIQHVTNHIPYFDSEYYHVYKYEVLKKLVLHNCWFASVSSYHSEYYHV